MVGNIVNITDEHLDMMPIRAKRAIRDELIERNDSLVVEMKRIASTMLRIDENITTKRRSLADALQVKKTYELGIRRARWTLSEINILRRCINDKKAIDETIETINAAPGVAIRTKDAIRTKGIKIGARIKNGSWI